MCFIWLYKFSNEKYIIGLLYVFLNLFKDRGILPLFQLNITFSLRCSNTHQASRLPPVRFCTRCPPSVIAHKGAAYSRPAHCSPCHCAWSWWSRPSACSGSGDRLLKGRGTCHDTRASDEESSPHFRSRPHCHRHDSCRDGAPHSDVASGAFSREQM